MRHANHKHTLGVKKEHRKAMVSALATGLLQHGQIETTLAKAKALKPFADKIITMAKKAASTDDKAKKLHYRRLAYARMNNIKYPVDVLFDEKVSEFMKRSGGYTRIYKLVPRVGDAADVALIELVAGSDEGYKKRKPTAKKGKKSAKTAKGEASATDVASAESDSKQAG